MRRRVSLCIVLRVRLFLLPDHDRQDEYRHDDDRAYRTEWAEHADDRLLVDDIRVEAYPTSGESCEELGKYSLLSDDSCYC